MQVHYDEGLATHIGSEPCVSSREAGDEASAGEPIGQPLREFWREFWGQVVECQNNFRKSSVVSGSFLGFGPRFRGGSLGHSRARDNL